MSHRRFDIVSSGPKIRNDVGFIFEISAKNPDNTFMSMLRFESANSVPRFDSLMSLAYDFQSGNAKSSAFSPRARPPLARGFEAIRLSPLGAISANSAFNEPSALNNSSGLYEFIHSSNCGNVANFFCAKGSGTWWARNESSIGIPDWSWVGPPQPFGKRAMITGHAAISPSA